MQYHVSRNGQTYGPYTMEDLQRYVASGHVLLTDTAKSDEMPDWVPVSQLLGGSASAAPGGTAPIGGPAAPVYSAGAYGVPGGYAPHPGLQPPPNLHWGFVLLFDLLTCSLFQLVWNLILAAWFRRVYPPTKILLLYAAAAVLIFAQGAFGQKVGFIASQHGMHVGHGRGIAGYGVVAITCWVVRLLARFTFRAELEAHYNTVEPIGLVVNPVLTFFFGGIYLQSVMNRINDIKRSIAFGGYPR